MSYVAQSRILVILPHLKRVLSRPITNYCTLEDYSYINSLRIYQESASNSKECQD